jgi:hypothetical protein
LILQRYCPTRLPTTALPVCFGFPFRSLTSELTQF